MRQPQQGLGEFDLALDGADRTGKARVSSRFPERLGSTHTTAKAEKDTHTEPSTADTIWSYIRTKRGDKMTGRITYAAPISHQPVGGIRILHRHVELLKDAGYNSVIWHTDDSTTSAWFESSAPVVVGDTLSLDHTDTLVIPESLVCTGIDPAPGCRKVIYNQGHLLTFANTTASEFPLWDPPPPMWVSSLMSRDVLCRLKDALPICGIKYVPHSIDTDLFQPSTVRERKIAWMPRKRPLESKVLHSLFASDNRFKGIELRPIDGSTERQTAAELATTSVFIPLGLGEGFGLPTAEALASGCVVVGYAAGGGAELFKAPGTYLTPESDVIAVVEHVAKVIANPPSSKERLNYRKWIEDRYPLSQQRECLVQALQSVREHPAKPGLATHPIKLWQKNLDEENLPKLSRSTR